MESSISSPSNFTTVEIDGSSYVIALPQAGSDYIQGLIHDTRQPYELEMLMAMKETLGEGDLVLDVGANIGNHTLFLAGVVGTRVISYEPDERLSNALNHSIAHNGLGSRVSVRPVAVASEPGRLTLVDDVEGNLGAQHLTESPNAAGIEVSVVALDDELPNQRVAAIKIDVEGFESHVIEGALMLIERDRPDLWIECLDAEHFLQIFSHISDFGYRPDGVFNASPTIRFIYEPVATRDSLTRVVERLVDRLYSERRDFLRTRSALQGANAKYRDAMESNDDLSDELALWQSLDGRETVCEGTGELHEYTDALAGSLRRFFEANDEISSEAIREAMSSVLDCMSVGNAEDSGIRPSDHHASSEHGTIHQLAQLRALALTTADIYADLNRMRSTNANLLLEKQNFQRDLTTVIDEVETLRSTHRRYREDFNILREYVSDTEIRLSELTRISEDNMTEIEKLDTALEDAQAEQDERDRQVTLLQQQQVKDRAHIGALMRARDRFRRQAEQETKQRESYENQLIELNSKHRALSDQKICLADALTTAHSDRDTAEKALAAAKTQLQDLRTSRTYRAGQAWRNTRTWKGFCTLVPTLISIAREGRRTK